MTPNPISVTSNTKLIDALAKMIAKGAHCLPVVKEGIVVGILTSTDVLESFQTILESLTKNPHLPA
jgi:CBS domain-containing protein